MGELVNNSVLPNNSVYVSILNYFYLNNNQRETSFLQGTLQEYVLDFFPRAPSKSFQGIQSETSPFESSPFWGNFQEYLQRFLNVFSLISSGDFSDTPARNLNRNVSGIPPQVHFKIPRELRPRMDFIQEFHLKPLGEYLLIFHQEFILTFTQDFLQ